MTQWSAVGDIRHQHVSLVHGWLPLTIQAATVVVMLTAIGWRTRRWRSRWLPLALGVGVALAAACSWFISSQGLADEPAPKLLWMWLAATGMATVVSIAGWRSARWWRRGTSLLGLPMCLVCSALAVNSWVGYFPTVQAAWGQLTAGPLPDQTDQATVVAMAQKHRIPNEGVVVPVQINSAGSGFRHRGEFVYLPPAWFATSPAPHLPTLMMIGGEFNTPGDWLRAGNAIKTVDDFAAANGGRAPVLVFVDTGGAFNNDTECVNGSRGNAADHLTKDVVPFMEATYGVSAEGANWGVVGWSMGGTCAVDLTTMHPDAFTTFEDIAGDAAPNSGTKQQTIKRLFGGNANAYAAFDPASVIIRHGRYRGVSGWFAISDSTSSVGPAARVGGQAAAANSLCTLGTANGITCAVVPQPGRHDWPFADRAFAAALPWLAGQIGTPGIPDQRLPGPPSMVAHDQ